MTRTKGLVVSSGERQVLRVLERYNGIVKVFPKVNFFDVIDWNTEMGYTEHGFLERTHFDFVVCENEMPYRPLSIVEYDGLTNGYKSDSDNNRDWKMSVKKRISEKEGLPLLVLTEKDLSNLDETIKEFMLNLLL